MEGQMTPNFMFNGFVIRYSGDGAFVDCGWMSNNEWEGNVISNTINKEGKMVMDPNYTGWFQKNQKVGELKEDQAKPKFTIEELFS